ncbi:MAG: UpxY family transcription antiterminator [Bacteroidales bacterium]|jgi:transcription antitermination factor NusG|nr:UpxY family transcription antiterminator [Bacteroidales bacterium]
MKEWFALYTVARKEKVLEREFAKQGTEAYLPMRKELRQWKDRKKLVEVPLFPSYIFVKTESNTLYKLVGMTGAVKFIYFEGKPVPVPQHQIDSIKILLDRDIKFELQRSNVKVGDRVEIREGMFAGLTGVIKKEKKTTKFVVAVDALQVSLIIEVDKKEVLLVNNNK